MVALESGCWATGRADVAPLTAEPLGGFQPTFLSSTYLPPALKGGWDWRSRQLGGVEGAQGYASQAVFTLSPANGVLEKPPAVLGCRN